MFGELTGFIGSRLLLLIPMCIGTALTGVGYVSAKDSRPNVQPVTYSRDIRPLLEQYCVECHSGWFPDGGLRLDTIEAIFKGGNSGPVIVPGSPEKGWLIYTLTKADQRRMQMPPTGARLSKPQVDMIKEWIRQGAK